MQQIPVFLSQPRLDTVGFSDNYLRAPQKPFWNNSSTLCTMVWQTKEEVSRAYIDAHADFLSGNEPRQKNTCHDAAVQDQTHRETISRATIMLSYSSILSRLRTKSHDATLSTPKSKQKRDFSPKTSKKKTLPAVQGRRKRTNGTRIPSQVMSLAQYQHTR